MDNNKQILKQLSQGSSAQSSSRSSYVPNFDAVKKLFKKTNKKQVLDVLLFSVGIYAMFRFGKTVAETIDNQMPTEKSMMDMMKGM
jgi:hypothetical protein